MTVWISPSKYYRKPRRYHTNRFCAGRGSENRQPITMTIASASRIGYAYCLICKRRDGTRRWRSASVR